MSSASELESSLQLDKESDCEKGVGGGGGDYSKEAINRGAGLFEEIR